MDAKEQLPTLNLEELEKLAVKQALEKCGGNRIEAAIMVGKSVRWVRYRIIQYGLGNAWQDLQATRKCDNPV